MTNETVVLMFSGGVDSVVCLHELVKQGITPKLFFFQTYKVKKKHIDVVRQNAKRLSPNSEFYTFKPRTIDFIAGWMHRETAKKSYFVYMTEYEDKNTLFYPLQYCDKLVLGYVGKEPKGRRRKGELGLAQTKLIKQCRTYHYKNILLPLAEKTTREVDEIFKSLPEEVQKDTLSTTRNYAFGGSYIHD